MKTIKKIASIFTIITLMSSSLMANYSINLKLLYKGHGEVACHIGEDITFISLNSHPSYLEGITHNLNNIIFEFENQEMVGLADMIGTSNLPAYDEKNKLLTASGEINRNMIYEVSCSLISEKIANFDVTFYDDTKNIHELL